MMFGLCFKMIWMWDLEEEINETRLGMTYLLELYNGYMGVHYFFSISVYV